VSGELVNMSHLASYIFNNQSVTVLFDNSNNAWFKAKDVAEILGYANTKEPIRSHVKDKYRKTHLEIGGVESRPPLNYQSNTVYISEPGLYSLIIKSKMTIAEKFQDWVFEDVLPSIRKHGEYKLKQENIQLMNQNSHLLQEITNFIVTNQQLAQINSEFKTTNDILCKENQSMNQLLTEQSPKVAVVPEDNELKHVFCVLIKETLLEMYGVCEYKCIRIQKRSFIQALTEAKREGFEMCYLRENVPNGINILNKAKEVMRGYGMHFDCARNNILTSHNFVNIVEHVMDNA
jgi:prophage antirepressor-like protein